VREDGRIFGGEKWQEKVYDREELKKLLWTARNRSVLYMPMEWMNETRKAFKIKVVDFHWSLCVLYVMSCVIFCENCVISVWGSFKTCEKLCGITWCLSGRQFEVKG
jgi:hypothetical protein